MRNRSSGFPCWGTIVLSLLVLGSRAQPQGILIDFQDQSPNEGIPVPPIGFAQFDAAVVVQGGTSFAMGSQAGADTGNSAPFNVTGNIFITNPGGFETPEKVKTIRVDFGTPVKSLRFLAADVDANGTITIERLIARIFDGAGRKLGEVVHNAPFSQSGGDGEVVPIDFGEVGDIRTLKVQLDNVGSDTTMTRLGFGIDNLELVPMSLPPFCVAAPKGLVAWWPGDGDARDITTGAKHGILHGTTFSPGIVGQAFDFDGVDDFVSVPHSASLQPQTMTVAAWIKVASNPSIQFLIAANSGPYGVHGYELGITPVGSSGRARFLILTGKDPSGMPNPYGDAIGVTGMVDDEWHHVAGTYDGSSAKVYVDGVLEGQANVPLPVQYTADDLFIGKRQYFHGNLFPGSIDEVAIYDRAFTAEEVRDFSSMQGVCKPACVQTPDVDLRMSFDQSDGTAIADDSGNDRPGTLNGSVSIVSDGVTGSAVSFNGVDGEVLLPNNTGLNYQDWQKQTIGFWIKWRGDGGDLTTRQYIWDMLADDFDVGTSPWALVFIDETLNPGLKASAGYGGTGPEARASLPTIGVFEHYVCLFNKVAGQIKIYKNGSLENQIAWVPSQGSDQASLRIGNINPRYPGLIGRRPLNATLDEFFVLNAELSEEEIRAIYRAGSAGFCRNENADCNSNGILDGEDLASGASQDCNANVIPDECDIAQGLSPDEDANDVPDECELPPAVVGQDPAGTVSRSFDHIDVRFNVPIDESTLLAGDLVLDGPNGAIAATAVLALGERTYRFVLPKQSTDGEYTLALGPEVQSTTGRSMAAPYEATILLARPDLKAISITGPVAGYTGQKFEVKWMVKNEGAEVTQGAWYDQVYISTDPEVGGDILLASVEMSFTPAQPLPQGGPYKRFAPPLSLPESAGNYWLIVVVEGTAAIEERDESNNIAVTIGPITVEPAPFTDLQVTEIVTPPSGVLSGTMVQISYTVKNGGNAPPDSSFWKDSVFLSRNQNLRYAGRGAGDQDICIEPYGERFIPNGSYLPSGESYTQPVDLPLLHDQPGPWYVYVITDRAGCHSPGNVSEANEANNLVRSEAFTVDIEPQPDLTAEVSRPQEIAFSDEPITLKWHDVNQGLARTDSGHWVDAVYLSSNNLNSISAGDLSLGSRSRDGEPLEPGSSTPELSITARLPADLQGPHHVKIAVDTGNQISEYDREDNVAVSGATVTVTLNTTVDLHPVNFGAPGSAIPGQEVTVTWEAVNIGAPPRYQLSWVDAIYLSADATFDRDRDQRLGTSSHSTTESTGLPTLPDYGKSLTVRLPNLVSPGPYWMLLVVDSERSVFENSGAPNTGEADNALFLPIRIDDKYADLLIEAGSSENSPVPTSGVPGQPIAISWRVRNDGNGPTPVSAWADRVYLSRDDVVDQGDKILATVFHSGPLASGASYSAEVEEPVSVPFVEPGPYWLLFVTDARDEVFERSPGEENNIARSAFTVNPGGPHLKITTANREGIARTGETVRLQWTVCNIGDRPTSAGSWRDDVFLSRSSTLDPGAVLLASVPHVGELAAGDCYTASIEVRLPPDWIGSFHFLVLPDADNRVLEAGGVGDPTPVDIEIAAAADLIVSDVQTSGPGVAGETLHLEWTVTNAGDSRTNGLSWVDRAYLSSDTGFDGGDKLIVTRSRNGALESKARYTVAEEARSPFDVAGNFWVVVVTDASASIIESDEGNNALSSAGTVGITPSSPANLVASAIGFAEPAVSGQPLDVSWTIHNAGLGSTSTSAWRDSVYLSRDQFLDRPGDLFLGAYDHDRFLDPDESRPVHRGFAVPLGTNGLYYLFVVADSNGRVYEAAREDDNIARSVDVVDIDTPRPSDLVVDEITLPGPSELGAKARFEWRTRNAGSEPISGAWEDALYLSRDEFWDLADARVGRFRTQTAGAMLPNQSVLTSIEAEIPAVTPGSYHLVVRSDVFEQILETNQENNLIVSIGTFAVTAIRLELGATRSESLQNGASKYFALATPAGETVQITLEHLSPGAWTELYVRFGDTPTPGRFEFVYGNPGTPKQDVMIPRTEEGTYYILARATAGVVSPTAMITAQVLPFGISAVAPQKVGAGEMTLRLSGAQLDPGTSFELRDPRTGRAIGASETLVRSSTSALALFNLRDVALGLYDLIALSGSGKGSITVTGAVEVEEPLPLSVHAELVPPASIRRGQVGSLRVVVTNSGNLNAPVAYLQLWTANEPRANLSSPALRLSSLPHGRTLMGGSFHWTDLEPGGRRELDFLISVGAAYPKASLEVLVASSAHTLPGFRAGPFALHMEAWRRGILASAAAPEELRFFAEDQEAWSNLTQEASPLRGLGRKDQESRLESSLAGKVGHIVFCAALCFVLCLPTGPVHLPCEVICHILCDTQEIARDEDILFPDGETTEIPTPGAIDPNEMNGSEGFGEERWVGAIEPLRYRIHFENLQDASSPAADVVIRSKLDPALNPGSVRLGNVHFGDLTVEVPDHRVSFATELDLTLTHGVRLSIVAGVDAAAREVFCIFRSSDPATGEFPLDALLGFLPPSDGGDAGRGWVEYTVRSNPAVITGTVVRGSATIVFDNNEPIDTNEVFNTLDVDPPECQIDVLRQTAGESGIEVEWSGADKEGGSGLRGFDLLMSRDGAPVEVLLSKSRATSALFHAEPGHSYSFWCRAIDNAENRQELDPEEPAAMIRILSTGFRRADSDANSLVGITDAIRTLDFLFKNGALPCLDSADANDDGSVDISDPVYILFYLFAAGSAPPAPGSSVCGADPTHDTLNCESYLSCE